MHGRHAVKVGLAAAALVAAAATPALATTTQVGGGTWSYDTGAKTAWSNYKHPDNWHASSVLGVFLAKSGCTVKGTWALASVEKGNTTAKAYYDPKCK